MSNPEDRAREIVEDLVRQFGYWSDAAGGYTTGGLSTLEDAFEYLGWDDPHPDSHGRCDQPGCLKQSSSGWPSALGYRWTCHEHSNFHAARKCNWPADSSHWAA